MSVKNLTPMALVAGAVKEFFHSLLEKDASSQPQQRVAEAPVTKKTVLSHMRPSAKYAAASALDMQVSTFKVLSPHNKESGLGAFQMLMLPGQLLIRANQISKICRYFGQENQYDACKRDVGRWIDQEVAKK